MSSGLCCGGTMLSLVTAWDLRIHWGFTLRRNFRMSEVARPFYRACLLTAFAAAVLTVGCGKKPVVSHEPPPAPPPAARPTVTLQANPTTINKGDASTLSW